MNKRLIFLLMVLTLPLLKAGAAEYRFNCNGKELAVVPFKHYHYASFDMSSPVEISLQSEQPIHSFEISPKNRKIKGRLEGNTIHFTLEHQGYIMVRINETERFFIFAEKPETIPSDTVNVLSFGIDATGRRDMTTQIQQAMEKTASQGKTLFFPAGSYLCRQLRPVSHTHIYLKRGATLQANLTDPANYMSDDGVKTRKFIYIKDAKDVRISGRGAINGNGRQMRTQYGDQARMRLIMAINSEDLDFEGVMFQDPGSWNTQILLCRNVTLRHIKLMNDIELSNTDGFDPDATQNMLIENCFAYCSDDNVAIKTTNYSNYLGDVDNITVRGCVFLTKKSSLKVGTETRGELMKNIRFEDNDVLESDRGMALYVSDGAILENVSYINNRFERNHPDAKQAGFYFQVSRRNDDSPLGQIRNVCIQDCTFEVPFPNPSAIKYEGKGNGIDVIIKNLIIGGKKITSTDEGRITVKNAKVVFE